MKLYYTKGACSLACRIIINEIGLACDYVAVDLKAKRTEQGDDFFAINPKGAVPTLVTNSNEVITENAVIQQYLADETKSTQLLPSVGDIARYHVLEWLNYTATEMHKGFSWFFYPNISENLKNDIFIPMMNKKLNFIDKHLEGKKYLLGDAFTLPDAYMFVMLRWANMFKFNLEKWPNISRFYNELLERKSIKVSLQQENII